MTEDKKEIKVMVLLKAYTKPEQNSGRSLITRCDAKDFSTNVKNFT